MPTAPSEQETIAAPPPSSRRPAWLPVVGAVLAIVVIGASVMLTDDSAQQPPQPSVVEGTLGQATVVGHVDIEINRVFVAIMSAETHTEGYVLVEATIQNAADQAVRLGSWDLESPNGIIYRSNHPSRTSPDRLGPGGTAQAIIEFDLSQHLQRADAGTFQLSTVTPSGEIGWWPIRIHNTDSISGPLYP